MGSNNRNKIIIKLQRYYQKQRNARKYYTYLITTTIVKENDIIVCESLKVKENDIIVCESLKVKEMIENKKYNLAKYIANSSLSEIIRQLLYKRKWKNKKIYQIDTYSQVVKYVVYVEIEIKN